MTGGAVVERDVLPVGRYRMPYPGRDGVLLRRGAVLERLLHVGGEEPVVTRAWAAANRVRMRAEAAFARRRARGDRAHALRARHRPRLVRVPPALPPRSARRAGDPRQALAAAAAPPRAVRGARLGDLGAADRVGARREHPASPGVAARAHERLRHAARPALAGAPGRPLAGRAGGLRARREARPGHDPGRARGQPRAVSISRPRAELAAPPRDPEHRRLDGGVARLPRPGPRRPVARAATSPT